MRIKIYRLLRTCMHSSISAIAVHIRGRRQIDYLIEINEL